METKRLLLTSTLALGLWIAATAQVESQLTCRRYTTQDGLPQMQTERLWQDSRGYIYIGTLSGFVRYDGRTFTSFLKGRRFNIVGFAETDGTVRAFDFRRQWLTSFDDVEMVPIDPQGRWLLNNFNSGSLPDGYVLLENEQEADRRLCQVTAAGFHPVVKGALLDRMTPDRKLYLDTTGLYVPTAQGLYCVEGRKAQLLTAKPDIFTLLRTDSTLLSFSATGIHAVGSHGLRLLTSYSFKVASYGLIVRRLANGHLVIADEHSLYEYDGQQVKMVATGFNLVKDLLVDRWNRLWVATYQGLYCYFNRAFRSHRLTDGSDIVRSIGVDDSDRLLLGTLNGKLIVDGHIVEDRPDNYFVPSVATLNGTVYMAAAGGIMCYDGSPRWLQLPQDRYQFVARAGRRLIIGSRRYIGAYDPQTGVVDTLSTETPYPWCAAEDGQGRLWVGTTFGLYADGKKVDYHQQLIVTTMEDDRQGNIFFASKDSVFLIHNGQVEPLAMPELSGHEVRSLHISPKGFLVVAAIDGLFVGKISSDYTVSQTRFFNHTNGFTTLEPQMATMGEQSDGTVWLAGVEDMTSFRPADLLAYDEEDTFIAAPLRWWQHWWVLAAGVCALAAGCWLLARRYEKHRQRRRLISLQREKLQREQQIEAIRQKAFEAATNELAQDIVRMTERTEEERLTLRTASGTVVVGIKDIVYFKGDGNYSQMVTFHDTTTVLTGLGALERMLNADVFVRADRSTLVNIHHIYRLLPKQHRCIFRSPTGEETEVALLAPAFKRLASLL